MDSPGGDGIAHQRLPDPSADPIQEPAAELVRSTSRAKRATARMYRAWQAQAPDSDARHSLAQLAIDEATHARALDGLVGILSLSPPFLPDGPVFERNGHSTSGSEPWPSALMAVFALDQAATACLTALAHAPHPNLGQVARTIVTEEEAHQRFVLNAFRKLADETPGLGPRLATEMLVARDWVRDVFPRRSALQDLVVLGMLPAEGPKAHDSFLASLGDRLQDALGVLGS